jgi:arylsulfatase A
MNNMKPMIIKSAFLLFGLCISTVVFAQKDIDQEKPNIVILLADDMGYGDLGCYGGDAKTPHLDALAGSGIKFTNCYAGAPNCSPSRVSLLTGRMPVRAGMYSYRPPEHVMHLKDEEVTIAELLKGAGYQTAHFGKWHLGCLPQDKAFNQPQPNEQGFDYSLGTENNSMPSHLNPVNFVRNGKEIGKQEGYSCQLIANEVEDWLANKYNDKQPFFLYVPFHEPHAKVAAPPEMVANYPDFDEKSAEYLACIENMDSAAGRILAMLEAKGLDKNTMVFFGSDNGSYRYGSNDPLRGKKGEVYDGGIKVPGIFSFPKVFEGKRILDNPIWFPDLLPTICSLADVEVPTDRSYDGINLIPILRNESTAKREQPMLWFFYRSSPEIAMRDNDYMLIARANDTVPRTHFVADIDMPFIKTLQPEFFELYNVTTDPCQQHDLAEKEPKKLAELKAEFFSLFEEARKEGAVWEGLPVYNPKKANHNKPAEFLKNQKIYLKN